jgi:uncharacterized protein involved in exopolysaccharide biosynthesis
MPKEEYFVDQSRGLGLMDMVMLVWRRRWLIAIPTLGVALLAGLMTFFLPKEWKISTVIQVGRYINQSPAGALAEIPVIDPRSLAARINQEAYSSLVARKLNVRLDAVPAFAADNPVNTDIVLIVVRDRNPRFSATALETLLTVLREDLDRRIELERKRLELMIDNGNNIVLQKNLDIRIKELEKDRIRMKISSARTRSEISEARAVRLLEEMKAVKARTDAISDGKIAALGEKKDAGEALSFLVYSNEILQNLRYYGTIEDSLNAERIQREELRLAAESDQSSLKDIDATIEKVRSEIADWNTQIALFRRILAGTEPTSFLKEPTISPRPVGPSKRKNAFRAGLLALILFTGVAFFLDGLQRHQARLRTA